MRSMAIDRRQFLLGSERRSWARGVAPSFAAPARTDETYFSARADGAGNNQVVAFDGGGDILLDLRPAGALSRHRRARRRRSVRRGGAAARYLRGRHRSRETQPSCRRLESTPGRTFAGHAVFSADGRWLLHDRRRRRGGRGFRLRPRRRRCLSTDAELSHPRDRAARTAVVGRCADDRRRQWRHPDQSRQRPRAPEHREHAAVAGADRCRRRFAAPTGPVARPSFISSRSAIWQYCPAGTWPSACSIKARWRTTCRWSASSQPTAACSLLEMPAESGARVRQYIGSVAADASGPLAGGIGAARQRRAGLGRGDERLRRRHRHCRWLRPQPHVVRRRVPADERRRDRRARDLRRAAAPAEDGIQCPRRWPVGQSRRLPAALTTASRTDRATPRQPSRNPRRLRIFQVHPLQRRAHDARHHAHCGTSCGRRGSRTRAPRACCSG